MTDAALSLHGVRVVLDGRVVLDDVDATFARGGLHAVVGRSGAGKSVLMKAACGLLPIAAGRVVRGDVVFVHQDPALLDDLDVDENVRFAVERRAGVSRTEARARVARWRAAFALHDVRRRRPRELSPGVLRKVALARALCLAPEVLVVDEPTTGLDPEAALQVDEALRWLHGSTAGATVIVVTHAPRTVARLRPTLTLVADGRARRLPADTEARDHRSFVALLEARQ